MLIVAASPLAAFTLIELEKIPVTRGDSFRTHVGLSQTLLGDGSVRFLPGKYDVEVLSLGDGSVRASFFDKSGRKAGEAKGIIAVLKQGQAALKQGEAAPPAGTNLPAVQSQGAAAQKVAPSSPSGQVAINFAKLGFGPNSRAIIVQKGQKADLQIVSRDEKTQVLIGLLLPAVQKVREAAAKP
jgi:hypothetical protein